MKRNWHLILAASTLLLSPAAFGVTPLTAAELARNCEMSSSDTDASSRPLCVTYVTGFLDGAVATDARVVENVVNELEREQSLKERAIRTRLSRKLRDAGPTLYAEFCVGTPVPVSEVVGHVIDELGSRDSLDGVLAQSIVYAALRKHYPCGSGER